MNIRYRVSLSKEERTELLSLIRGGKVSARKLKRAQILLGADRREKDEDIAKHVGVGTSTVYRTKQRFVEEGMDAALSEAPRPGASRRLSAADEAILVATACSKAPAGRAKWTLGLLAERVMKLTGHKSVSVSTVGRRLQQLKLKPWSEKMWCIPELNAEFVARMEDVLSLYASPRNPNMPVVCFDETPRQLIGETRVPISPKPGRKARVDYEYERKGTANVFMFVDAHAPWRHAKVTDTRSGIDFAICMKELVDVHYPKATQIRVVLDNLSTHTPGAIYAAFPPAEARRILDKIEFHYTPKHASWLNMVEIEIGVMVGQCLDRRIDNKQTMIKEIAAWEKRRNQSKSKINWLFTVERAREKMGSAYPNTPQSTPKKKLGIVA
jgi:transposase